MTCVKTKIIYCLEHDILDNALECLYTNFNINTAHHEAWQEPIFLYEITTTSKPCMHITPVQQEED